MFTSQTIKEKTLRSKIQKNVVVKGARLQMACHLETLENEKISDYSTQQLHAS